MGSVQPIKRVAIIGAGPSGLVAASYLVAEKCFHEIKIFEQRDNVGGVWNMSSADKTKRISMPQTNPCCGNVGGGSSGNGNTSRDGGISITTSLELESPMYDYLETNIPKDLMGYSDKPFERDWPLFIRHENFLAYLEDYAEPYRELISLHTQVQNVRPHSTSTNQGRRWEVFTRDLKSGKEGQSVFDAVVVANGHYTVPFIPAVEGLRVWNKNYPSTIIHSKAYRKPENYDGKKVLIVGNSVSGLDISAQIGPVSRAVILCARTPSAIGPVSSAPWRTEVPGLAEFLPAQSHNRAVKFVDGSIQTDIDAVIFATGYFYNFPFLQDLDSPLVTHGLRTEHVYKHLFYIDNPTLVFPGLNFRIVPLPFAENQMSVVARIWAGRLSLPSVGEMKDWELQKVHEQGDGKQFHLLRFPNDAEALNELYNWAKSAQSRPGLENGGIGKLGKLWDERLVWMRGILPEIKSAFASLGSKRTSVRTIEELGLDYQKVSRERESEINVHLAEHA